VCDQSFPTATEHRALSDAARQLRAEIASGRLKADDDLFVQEIVRLDRARFNAPSQQASPEWGQAQLSRSAEEHIFRAGHGHALTLFALTSWYDGREDYVCVWCRRLAQLAEWVASSTRSEDALPRAGSDGPLRKRASAWKTWQQCQPGGFGVWFANTINSIADSRASQQGNLRVFVARVGRDLLSLAHETERQFARLETGTYARLLYKRAWMLTMFLRRDQGIVRCLVERAFGAAPRGSEAAHRWYDDGVFSQLESELPVDGRMLEIGQGLFGTANSEAAVADTAHSWGQKHGLPPSTLDVLFFAMD
jgi:hypothetical protein